MLFNQLLSPSSAYFPTQKHHHKLTQPAQILQQPNGAVIADGC